MKRFNNWRVPVFDDKDMTQWQWMCQHREGLKLGKNSDIGAFTYINAKFGVEIGEEVQIGSHCAIYSHNTIDDTQGKIVIETGARVGSHTVILPGVTIGAGAKVGAHSLVKQNVPDGAKYAGVPAKPIAS